MNMNEFYKEEVLELTEHLNTDWIGLHTILNKNGLETEGGYLFAYMESEECEEFGGFLTKGKQIYTFLIKDEIVTLTKIDNVEDIMHDGPQVLVAINIFEQSQTDKK